MNEFESCIAQVDSAAMRAVAIELLQLNVGLRCNMRCAHCHQSSSPDRNETMSDEVFAAALALATAHGPDLIDVTGGAPELHPHIRDFVRALRQAGFPVQLRTNLSAMLEPGCEDLAELWAKLGVRLLASLPSWRPDVIARQRGPGAWERSLEALRRLNALGYGRGDGLTLDLAANADIDALPEPGSDFETPFRRVLLERHGIHFDTLLVLTNMPLGRFRSHLKDRPAYEARLRAGFNPDTVARLACRRSLSVSWDGTLYDCDFNVGAKLPIRGEQRSVLSPPSGLATRRLAFASHCFACTAVAGSS